MHINIYIVFIQYMKTYKIQSNLNAITLSLNENNNMQDEIFEWLNEIDNKTYKTYKFENYNNKYDILFDVYLCNLSEHFINDNINIPIFYVVIKSVEKIVQTTLMYIYLNFKLDLQIKISMNKNIDAQIDTIQKINSIQRTGKYYLEIIIDENIKYKYNNMKIDIDDFTSYNNTINKIMKLVNTCNIMNLINDIILEVKKKRNKMFNFEISDTLKNYLSKNNNT
jgi:hypothetical protein